MVKLEDAVIARLDIENERFEILIEPETAQKLREGEDIPILENLVIDTIFKDSKKIDVSGKSKGKGFQGVVKRHGFHRGRKTHGSKSYRVPGSIGMAASPSRVLKGQKLPGRMGNVNKHIKNLEIVEIDVENNLLLVKGAVPGARNTVLRLTAGPK